MSIIFTLENDDYGWLLTFLSQKKILMTRTSLNRWAIRYGLIPGQFKNKRLLVEQMLSIWHSYFNNEQFKKAYETKYGFTIEDL
tara:strand:- start:3069 stop:3320 length:252 start_codon:yes stop_codon:yes gene_type:complete